MALIFIGDVLLDAGVFCAVAARGNASRSAANSNGGFARGGRMQ
jgi:hypothetical protein